ERDAIDPFGEQVADDLLLFRGRASGGDAKIHVDVAQFLRRVIATAARDGPEGGGVIRNEGEFEFLVGCATAGGGSCGLLFGASRDEKRQTERGEGQLGSIQIHVVSFLVGF